MTYRNRAHAGRELARYLARYANRSDVLVLGLPRGGVPVAAEVAAALGAPLDVLLVRKLGVPGHEELALGAIAEGGIEVLNGRLIHDLGLSRDMVQRVAVRERLELERRDQLFRGGRSRAAAAGHIVILVDDGLATGATMEAAVVALREIKPARIVVAAPVGAPETCQRLRRLADDVVCPVQPPAFNAVGMWYDDFTETSDDDVRDQLARAGRLMSAAVDRRHGDDAVEIVRKRALPLAGTPTDYDALLDGIGDARVVLLGEATHGTHEFYRERAVITRRLIAERGFGAVAVEADWPDAYRINRFVRGAGTDAEATDALSDFRRFPAWMWRNADMLDFMGWLRARNDAVPPGLRAGFYGLDLYSLRASMAAVLSYLRKVDPAAAKRARERYACFDRFGDEMQKYAYATQYDVSASCEREVVSQLVELRRRAAEYALRDGRLAADDFYVAEQNAKVVQHAEAYYRTMLGGHIESWNLRDRHMMGALEDLLAYLETTGSSSRVVVWAHNSHLGDARATELGQRGELNVGQLARERFGSAAVLVGFTTFTGTVTAASDWDGPAERKQVRPALAGSYEHLLHEAAIPRALLPLRSDPDLASALAAPRLERAIGVLYLPETERRSHYFRARLSDQFDYVVHIDRTRAVEPLERTSMWAAGEVEETFPSGL
jgi:erythromycin esterase-like protein/predicted phosphoribosyltransferase